MQKFKKCNIKYQTKLHKDDFKSIKPKIILKTTENETKKINECGY